VTGIEELLGFRGFGLGERLRRKVGYEQEEKTDAAQDLHRRTVCILTLLLGEFEAWRGFAGLSDPG
jgi:hypothetical protein